MGIMGEYKNEIIKGKSFEIGGRIIYPIVQITIQKNNEGSIISAGVNPIAIIVEENKERYILPLNDEKMDLDENFL
jgi:hypothetical protein